MFNLEYYKSKKAKIEERLTKVINDAFNDSAKLWADYFNNRAILEEELKEIEQIIKDNNMSDEQEVVATPEVAEEVVAEEVATETTAE